MTLQGGKDSLQGATIKTVANYFHAQLSDPDPAARLDLLKTIREQNMQAAQKSPTSADALPNLFVKDDGAGHTMPAMKERPSAEGASDDDYGLGAPKGRRRQDDSFADRGSGTESSEPKQLLDRMNESIQTQTITSEVARPVEVAANNSRESAGGQQQYEVIRL